MEGHPGRASNTIRWAIEAGRPERYIRPFLEEAAHTLPLLRSIAAASQHGDPYLTDLIGEAERTNPASTAAKAALVLEPLTERERQILHYLPSHLTLRQIGSAMHLSTNTVKTHVKAIYRKIGAFSRDDAVNIAQTEGLLI